MCEIVYLVGQISIKAKETYEWRERFIVYLTEKGYVPNKLIIINPCAAEWNQTILDADYKTEPYLMRGAELLPTKDYNFVKKSSILVCNLNQYDLEKPLLGSFFEMAWGWEWKKTIIGIHNGETNDILKKHPFIDQAVNVWVKNELQSARLVERFFL